MDRELHYITFDPQEIYNEMQLAYMNAGGDALYPGDEKEMLLRGVQQIMVQAFAGVDNALRMATLRYATGEYLDLYAEGRNCARNEAKAATAEIEIHFRASGQQAVIQAGESLTADGEHIYYLTEDVLQTGYEHTVQTTVICRETGAVGNGLIEGAQMQFLIPHSAIESVYCSESAKGGQNREDDESFRQRIREYGLVNITTGPAMQYESAAMAVTSEIIDAKAMNGGDGVVNIALLLASQTGAQAIIDSVKAALDAESTRPLTDNVSVFQCTPVAYTLNVQYMSDNTSDIASALQAAVTDYQNWQDHTIGRAFNPDKLMSAIYQAGATRVLWGSGSNFGGGAVQYTEIQPYQACKGTITLTRIGV